MFGIFTFIFQFLLPSLVSAYAYVRILVRLRRHIGSHNNRGKSYRRWGWYWALCLSDVKTGLITGGWRRRGGTSGGVTSSSPQSVSSWSAGSRSTFSTSGRILTSHSSPGGRLCSSNIEALSLSLQVLLLLILLFPPGVDVLHHLQHVGVRLAQWEHCLSVSPGQKHKAGISVWLWLLPRDTKCFFFKSIQWISCQMFHNERPKKSRFVNSEGNSVEKLRMETISRHQTAWFRFYILSV